MTDLTSPRFHNEDAARAHIEASRWPTEVNCPHCGSLNVHKMAGKTQAGYFLCNDCRDKFTCRTGTVMERSHVPLHKWLLAIHLMSASKKGYSAHQLMRTLGLGSYRTAWFMAHRIRLAMAPTNPPPIGGVGSIVEADETVIGRQEGMPPTKHVKGWVYRNIVLTLVERGGSARSWHVDGTTVGTLMPIIRANVARDRP